MRAGDRVTRPGAGSGCEGRPHLAHYLRFAQHQRVDAGGDAVEMAGDVQLGQVVERVVRYIVAPLYLAQEGDHRRRRDGVVGG